jgi:hypothetical protein
MISFNINTHIRVFFASSIYYMDVFVLELNNSCTIAMVDDAEVTLVCDLSRERGR